MTPAGFPHSETPGSKRVCRSPGLIAACRVLRRLPGPRHPPCAFGIFFLPQVASISEKIFRFSSIGYMRISLSVVYTYVCDRDEYVLSMMRTTSRTIALKALGIDVVLIMIVTIVSRAMQLSRCAGARSPSQPDAEADERLQGFSLERR